MMPSKVTNLLSDCRVLEFAALGPAPFAAMLLAGLGARIVRIERPVERQRTKDIMGRGRGVLTLDLKTADDQAMARALVSKADVLIEGYRPGVMERLGLGPLEVMPQNEALVYARMTGWGQTGTLSATAGHDINFLALTGALDAMGPPAGPPSIPLNLVGDYGGGGMLLALGIVTAYLDARQSGYGRVIDCAICDGVLALLSQFHGLVAAEQWGPRGTNHLDGGSHYYNIYRCSDGLYIAVGAVEPKFYRAFCERAGLTDALFENQFNRANWSRLKELTQATIESKARDEWLAIFEGTDACVTPVLTIGQALDHPHFHARSSLIEVDGVRQTAPVPQMSGEVDSRFARVRLSNVDDALSFWMH